MSDLLVFAKGFTMQKRIYDHRRYQRNKTAKKLNARKFEEMKECSCEYEPSLIKIGDRYLSPLEAKDNMELRFRAEMFNRTSAVSQLVEDRSLDYTRLTITFATANRVENNFRGSQESADNFLKRQAYSIRHFIERVVKRYKSATGETLMFKYNMEVQLLNGTNMHAHVIFYHSFDTDNSLALSKIIMDLRYSIKNKKLKKKHRKEKTVYILGVGRLYLQVSLYHQEELIYKLSLDDEATVYRKLNMIKGIDKKAINYANVESNLIPFKNYITGSWVWFSFLDAENMMKLHTEHD